MAFSKDPFGKISQDFTEAVGQAFGKKFDSKVRKKGESNIASTKPNLDLFDKTLGGVASQRESNWLGNTQQPKKLKYGFVILDSLTIKRLVLTEEDIFYLELPPQALSQKEIFATNISATRKGVIVETEGVIFKDIVIQGTTGVFPGPRGSANNAIPNFSSFTSAPRAPDGVDPKTGLSRNSSSTATSGYEEFIRLRQYFLKYAKEKVESDGDRFLVFVNEKDHQFLIVEPLEFTMERSSKSPLIYNYKIILKSIGSITDISTPLGAVDVLSNFAKVANIAANISATIAAARAVINQLSTALLRVSQLIDATFIGPLRQLQYATQDLADGITSTLALPGILLNNATSTVLDIRENLRTSQSSLQEVAGKNPIDAIKKQRERDIARAKLFAENITTVNLIKNDSTTPIPRSFVENLKTQVQNVQYGLADSVNLGSDLFDSIVDRTNTSNPGPLKTASDGEILLMAELNNIINVLNLALATNGMFESDTEEAYSQIEQQFNSLISIPTPTSVTDTFIQQNDSLEKIAQRELGDATRWVELVVLNKLKPPYIDSERSAGVKTFGDKLLVGQTSQSSVKTIQNKEVELTRNLSNLEKAMGVDLKITNNGDIEISNLKDLKLNAGIPNAAQAALLKVNIEAGGLLYHPAIGTDIQPGVKIKNALNYELQLLRSLSQDPRFDNINADVTVLGSTVIINTTLTLTGTGIQVPLQFSTSVGA